MSVVAYLIAYLAVVIFLGAVIAKVMAYRRHPQHVRWELYPVAHEAKRASWGGSYLEDVNWWEKKREASRVGELKVMIPEILLLKGVWEHNRSLWMLSFPFHFGLYILAGFAGLLLGGAILHAVGVNVGPGATGFGGFVVTLTNILGPIGFVLAFLGAAGLLVRRLTTPGLKNYSSFGHYFNLLLFMGVIGVAFYTWRSLDTEFHGLRMFLYSWMTFKFTDFGSTLFAVQMILIFGLLAYIPVTHMSHFFMKYFLWHDIRWGDEPNVNNPATDKKIQAQLGQSPTWAAEHINADGKKNWVDVASYNPAHPDGYKAE